MADLLAERAASFGEITALPVFQRGGAAAALQAVTLYVHSGQVLPVLSQNGTIDVAPAQRLNRLSAEKMLQGLSYSFLAAPVAGSGMQASNTDILVLAAVLTGQGQSARVAAEHVIANMAQLGVNWLSEGKPVTDPTECARRHGRRGELPHREAAGLAPARGRLATFSCIAA
ncbi:hypothetical protein DK427_08470 [Methylobacterium radiodurans]|uniref:Uncharacterized protein n=1 Tax=Methylobacterium radiodurans TaxID=2202828 RepID=A0A2U8VRE5_9HYPH|nr:hypothetical protein DK427_08470 [Methylobacterium radiodurans]